MSRPPIVAVARLAPKKAKVAWPLSTARASCVSSVALRSARPRSPRARRPVAPYAPVNCKASSASRTGAKAARSGLTRPSTRRVAAPRSPSPDRRNPAAVAVKAARPCPASISASVELAASVAFTGYRPSGEASAPVTRTTRRSAETPIKPLSPGAQAWRALRSRLPEALRASPVTLAFSMDGLDPLLRATWPRNGDVFDTRKTAESGCPRALMEPSADTRPP